MKTPRRRGILRTRVQRGFLALGLMLYGCVGTPFTEFRGSAKVEDGPAGCEAICKNWDMQVAGMVAHGEYSTSCICQKKGAELSLRTIGQSLMLSSSGNAAPDAALSSATEPQDDARGVAAGMGSGFAL